MGKQSGSGNEPPYRGFARGMSHPLPMIVAPLADSRPPTSTNLSTPRLAELGDALDVRSVDASPALRLLHPDCVVVGS
jgi:hypothetical protein